MARNESRYIDNHESSMNPNRISSFHVPCFICGELTKGLYNLHAKKNSQNDSYFPFLDTYQPPKNACPMDLDGSIAACFCCFSFLNCQWNLYEHNKVPYAKRIYWLKRTDGKPFSGIMMGAQSEYASQVLGLSSDQVPVVLEGNILRATEKLFHKKNVPIKVEDAAGTNIEEQSEALDLSLENKDLRPTQLTENCSLFNPIDQSLSGENSIRCHNCECQSSKCDDSKNIVSFLRLKEKFEHDFNFLKLHINEVIVAKSLDSSENISICDTCCTRLHLMHQFYYFRNIKDDTRNYYFRGHHSHKKFVTCVACHTSITNLSTTQCDGATSIDESQLNRCLSSTCDLKSATERHTESEKVELCCSCFQLICCDPGHYIKLCPTNCSLSNRTFDQHLKSRTLYEISIADYKVSDGALMVNLPCDICSETHNFRDMEKIFLSSDPIDSNKCFYPSLRYLALLDSSKVYGSFILCCKRCHDILYESYLDNIPVGNKNVFTVNLSYLASILCELSPDCDKKRKTIFNDEKNATHIKMERCKLKQNDNISSLVEYIDIGTTSIPFCYKDETWEPLLRDFEVILFNRELVKLPHITLQNPLNIGVNCFICGIFSNAGSTYVVWNKHFHPFKIINFENNWKNKEVGLVCNICFHSLVSQRQGFENTNTPSLKRNYVMSWYFCYVCSAGTFRARLHLLPVKDFPFLLKHTTTKKGIVANEGNDVIVCRHCYNTLNSQYLEMERLGVPVEMRQYNWIKKPPPEPQENFKNVSPIPGGCQQKNGEGHISPDKSSSCSLTAFQGFIQDTNKRKSPS